MSAQVVLLPAPEPWEVRTLPDVAEQQLSLGVKGKKEGTLAVRVHERGGEACGHRLGGVHAQVDLAAVFPRAHRPVEVGPGFLRAPPFGEITFNDA